MPTLEDIYCKYGEAAEAAALLETELGNQLLLIRATEKRLHVDKNVKLATEILESINRLTLGQLIKKLNKSTASVEEMEALFSRALDERNRLFHAFYRHHNFRRNSDEGRAIMIADLDSIHTTLLDAYKALMLLSGIDLYALVEAGTMPTPSKHVPI